MPDNRDPSTYRPGDRVYDSNQQKEGTVTRIISLTSGGLVIYVLYQGAVHPTRFVSNLRESIPGLEKLGAGADNVIQSVSGYMDSLHTPKEAGTPGAVKRAEQKFTGHIEKEAERVQQETSTSAELIHDAVGSEKTRKVLVGKAYQVLPPFDSTLIDSEVVAQVEGRGILVAHTSRSARYSSNLQERLAKSKARQALLEIEEKARRQAEKDKFKRLGPNWRRERKEIHRAKSLSESRWGIGRRFRGGVVEPQWPTGVNKQPLHLRDKRKVSRQTELGERGAGYLRLGRQNYQGTLGKKGQPRRSRPWHTSSISPPRGAEEQLGLVIGRFEAKETFSRLTLIPTEDELVQDFLKGMQAGVNRQVQISQRGQDLLAGFGSILTPGDTERQWFTAMVRLGSESNDPLLSQLTDEMLARFGSALSPTDEEGKKILGRLVTGPRNQRIYELARLHKLNFNAARTAEVAVFSWLKETPDRVRAARRATPFEGTFGIRELFTEASGVSPRREVKGGARNQISGAQHFIKKQYPELWRAWEEVRSRQVVSVGQGRYDEAQAFLRFVFYPPDLSDIDAVREIDAISYDINDVRAGVLSQEYIDAGELIDDERMAHGLENSNRIIQQRQLGDVYPTGPSWKDPRSADALVTTGMNPNAVDMTEAVREWEAVDAFFDDQARLRRHPALAELRSGIRSQQLAAFGLDSSTYYWKGDPGELDTFLLKAEKTLSTPSMEWMGNFRLGNSRVKAAFDDLVQGKGWTHAEYGKFQENLVTQLTRMSEAAGVDLLDEETAVGDAMLSALHIFQRNGEDLSNRVTIINKLTTQMPREAIVHALDLQRTEEGKVVSAITTAFTRILGKGVVGPADLAAISEERVLEELSRMRLNPRTRGRLGRLELGDTEEQRGLLSHIRTRLQEQASVFDVLSPEVEEVVEEAGGKVGEDLTTIQAHAKTGEDFRLGYSYQLQQETRDAVDQALVDYHQTRRERSVARDRALFGRQDLSTPSYLSFTDEQVRSAPERIRRVRRARIKELEEIIRAAEKDAPSSGGDFAEGVKSFIREKLEINPQWDPGYRLVARAAQLEEVKAVLDSSFNMGIETRASLGEIAIAFRREIAVGIQAIADDPTDWWAAEIGEELLGERLSRVEKKLAKQFYYGHSIAAPARVQRVQSIISAFGMELDEGRSETVQDILSMLSDPSTSVVKRKELEALLSEYHVDQRLGTRRGEGFHTIQEVISGAADVDALIPQLTPIGKLRHQGGLLVGVDYTGLNPIAIDIEVAYSGLGSGPITDIGMLDRQGRVTDFLLEGHERATEVALGSSEAPQGTEIIWQGIKGAEDIPLLERFVEEIEKHKNPLYVLQNVRFDYGKLAEHAERGYAVMAHAASSTEEHDVLIERGQQLAKKIRTIMAQSADILPYLREGNLSAILEVQRLGRLTEREIFDLEAHTSVGDISPTMKIFEEMQATPGQILDKQLLAGEGGIYQVTGLGRHERSGLVYATLQEQGLTAGLNGRERVLEGNSLEDILGQLRGRGFNVIEQLDDDTRRAQAFIRLRDIFTKWEDPTDPEHLLSALSGDVSHFKARYYQEAIDILGDTVGVHHSALSKAAELVEAGDSSLAQRFLQEYWKNLGEKGEREVNVGSVFGRGATFRGTGSELYSQALQAATTDIARLQYLADKQADQTTGFALQLKHLDDLAHLQKRAYLYSLLDKAKIPDKARRLEIADKLLRNNALSKKIFEVVRADQYLRLHGGVKGGLAGLRAIGEATMAIPSFEVDITERAFAKTSQELLSASGQAGVPVDEVASDAVMRLQRGEAATARAAELWRKNLETAAMISKSQTATVNDTLNAMEKLLPAGEAQTPKELATQRRYQRALVLRDTIYARNQELIRMLQSEDKEISNSAREFILSKAGGQGSIPELRAHRSNWSAAGPNLVGDQDLEAALSYLSPKQSVPIEQILSEEAEETARLLKDVGLSLEEIEDMIDEGKALRKIGQESRLHGRIALATGGILLGLGYLGRIGRKREEEQEQQTEEESVIRREAYPQMAPISLANTKIKLRTENLKGRDVKSIEGALRYGSPSWRPDVTVNYGLHQVDDQYITELVGENI